MHNNNSFHQKDMNGLKHPLKELPLSLTILELHGWCEVERTHSTLIPKHAIYRIIVCGQRWRKISLHSETSLNSLSLGKHCSNEPSFFRQTTVQADGGAEGGSSFVNTKALRNFLTVPELGNHAYCEWAFFSENEGMQYEQFTFFLQELFYSSLTARERAYKGPWHVNV